MDSTDVIQRLEEDGWEEVWVRGDHHYFRHPTKDKIIPVRHPAKNLPVGTLKSIERQSGVTLT